MLASRLVGALLIASGVFCIICIIYNNGLRKIVRSESEGKLFCKVYTQNRVVYGWAYKYAITAVRNCKDTQSAFLELYKGQEMCKVLVAYRDIEELQIVSSNMQIMYHNK